MSSEELLGTLEDLVDNVGDVLYDWEPGELDQLRTLAARLAETTKTVLDFLAVEETK